MNCVSYRLWLVGVTILSQIMHNFGGTLEGIRRSTAMKLILLKNYKDRVAEHGGRADETYHLKFIDDWERFLGSHDTTIEILNHVENDWMYTLYVASRSEAVITDLILSLHAKILAFHQFATYVISIFYYSSVPNRTILEDCRSVAVRLLFLSHLGTDELIQSITGAFDALLSAGDLSAITTLRDDLGPVGASLYITTIFLRSLDQLERPNEDQIKKTETYVVSQLLTPNREDLEHQEHLLLKFMLGTSRKSVLDEGTLGLIKELDQLKLFSAKAVNINKYLIKQAFKGPYTMADVIRANLIGSAEMIDGSRKIVVEEFEYMIPDKFEIFISKSQVTNNANLKDKHY